MDAEQNKLPGGGDHCGAAHVLDELGLVLHYVVGRHHDEDRGGVLPHGGKRGHGNGRRGVAGDRFEDYGLGRDAGTVQLLLDEEAVIVVAQQDRRAEAGFRREAL